MSKYGTLSAHKQQSKRLDDDPFPSLPCKNTKIHKIVRGAECLLKSNLKNSSGPPGTTNILRPCHSSISSPQQIIICTAHGNNNIRQGQLTMDSNKMQARVAHVNSDSAHL
ncbi:hypothetical protein ILYODFUR_022124 [Ilyodon furcidens]|uniref:Uncharacterized protein n=1 Tax=Ilyodon furcidens TaxID=33524 RepID=A0ABV0V807_9TELE